MTKIVPNLDLWMEPSPFQNRDAYLQKNHNWSVLSQYGLKLSDYVLSNFDQYEDRINNLISGTTQPSEIVDAHIDSWNVKWPTLKARLDNDEQTTPRILDIGQDSDAVSVFKIRDLSTNSDNLKFQVIKNLSKLNLPAMGYASTVVKNLSYDIID